MPAATLEELLRHDLLPYLFDETSHILHGDDHALALLRAAMANTDQRIAQDKPVTPAFLLAALLWPVVKRAATHLENQGEPPMVAMHNAAQQTIGEACQQISIPKRFSQPMREIWEFQLRLQRTAGQESGGVGRSPPFSRRLRLPAAARAGG